jgi:hypothetical protein
MRLFRDVVALLFHACAEAMSGRLSYPSELTKVALQQATTPVRRSNAEFVEVELFY